jgi:hypothetical protein
MNGWMAMWTIQFNWRLLLAGMLAASLSAQADELQDDNDIPTMELLEFLADWQTADGEYINPETLQELPEPDEQDTGKTSNAR